jgi:hypothetical protein
MTPNAPVTTIAIGQNFRRSIALRVIVPDPASNTRCPILVRPVAAWDVVVSCSAREVHPEQISYCPLGSLLGNAMDNP